MPAPAVDLDDAVAERLVAVAIRLLDPTAAAPCLNLVRCGPFDRCARAYISVAIFCRLRAAASMSEPISAVRLGDRLTKTARHAGDEPAPHFYRPSLAAASSIGAIGWPTFPTLRENAATAINAMQSRPAGTRKLAR